MSIRLTTRVSWSVLANLLSIYPLSLGTVCTPPAMYCNVKTNNSNHHLHPPLLQKLWFLIRKFPFLSAVRTTWKAKRFNRFFKVPFWQMEVLGRRRPRMMSNFLAVKNRFLPKCFKSEFSAVAARILTEHSTPHYVCTDESVCGIFSSTSTSLAFALMHTWHNQVSVYFLFSKV